MAAPPKTRPIRTDDSTRIVAARGRVVNCDFSCGVLLRVLAADANARRIGRAAGDRERFHHVVALASTCPVRQQHAEVGLVHAAVSVDVGNRVVTRLAEACAVRGQQNAKILLIDLAVAVQVARNAAR